MTAHTENTDASATGELHPKEAARREAVALHPYIAVTVQTTGIHPTTARMVAIDALTFNDAGEVGEEFHAILNPGGDPGPRHYHGLSREEVRSGQRFSKILKPLDRLLDDRTLIVHDTALSWGFIVSEARRAMSAAARANRNRSRSRGRSRRRQRVGHVPRPEHIVDTLATSRRQGTNYTDTRVAGLAQALGLPALSPVASVVRAGRSQEETSRETTQLLWTIYQTQLKQAKQQASDELGGDIASHHPSELRADRFGLQRPHIRVEAADAQPQLPNPGKYEPGKSLIEGMEVVIADDIACDPCLIIQACVDAGLVYSEYLHRETSVVISNKTTDLRGKAMHASRKQIPLMSDTAFLAAAKRVKPHPDNSDGPNRGPQSHSGGGASQSTGTSGPGKPSGKGKPGGKGKPKGKRRRGRRGGARGSQNNSA